MAVGNEKSTHKSAPFVADKDGYTRLHIAPLDPELSSLVLSSAIRPLARNISYHTLEAFPDRRYGFVEVPLAEAEKLKKKPESIPPPTGVVADEGVKPKKSHKKEKKEKKRKRGEPEVVDGVQLSDRKIKRGWTVSEGEMIKEKRKDKDRNKSAKEKKEKKDKKEKRSAVKSNAKQPVEEEEEEEGARKRKKRRSDREVVVHEFERSTKYPSFLRSTLDETKKSEPLTFEEGKGWVDGNGNVVEPLWVTRVPELPKPKSQLPKPKKSKTPPAPTPVTEEDDETSSSGSSSDSDAEEAPKPTKTKSSQRIEPAPASAQDEDDTSSSESSSDSEAEEATKTRKVANNKAAVSEVSAQNQEDETSNSGSSSESDEEASPSKVRTLAKTFESGPRAPAVPLRGANSTHLARSRLERDENGSSADAQPFSFFNNDDDIEDEAEAGPPAQIPMTPYSKQDFEFRNIRSAAPTPDTAHPSRSYHPWSTQEDDLVEEDEGDEVEADGEDVEDADGDMAMAGAATGGDQSKSTPATDFQKFFWENRGDLNRKWKKRRKTALKERRNRENRARAARAI
ncbi:hypothetical protein PG994_005685 [Apiospora phragmitis]|uniref:Uncharacterized protein n=1 Tax=Apiospora phragmitis TaxID=2905665 RepID=A0ABR1VCX9_9PEZI